MTSPNFNNTYTAKGESPLYLSQSNTHASITTITTSASNPPHPHLTAVPSSPPFTAPDCTSTPLAAPSYESPPPFNPSATPPAAPPTVISITSKASKSKQDAGHALIDEYYEKLSKVSNLTPRPSQIRLSKRVFDSFYTRTPSFLEAPTGTGKTIAYLLGAVAASLCSVTSKKTAPKPSDNENANSEPNTPENPPIILATATVTLQDQILHKDLPALLQAGIPISFSSIKGRQRYFCANSAHAQLNEHRDYNRQLDFLNPLPDSGVAHDPFELNDHLNQFLNAFENKLWDGELETYKGPTKYWPIINSNPDTCTQSRCDYHESCPFFAARKRMNTVSVLVTTQDFVLQDLMQKSSDAQEGLLRPEYFLVIDEAHHFPHKAHTLGATSLNPTSLAQKLQPLNAIPPILHQYPKIAQLFTNHKVQPLHFDPSSLLKLLNELQQVISAIYSECGRLVPHTLRNELNNPQFTRLHADLIIETSSRLETFKKAVNLLGRVTAQDLAPTAQKLIMLISPFASIIKDLNAQLAQLTPHHPTPSQIAGLHDNKVSPYNEQPNHPLLRSFNQQATDHALIPLKQLLLATPPDTALYRKRYSDLIKIISECSPLSITPALSKHILDQLLDYYKTNCNVSWIDASSPPPDADPASFIPQLTLYSESLAGTQLLQKILWDNPLITPSFLSATLGDIPTFQLSCGLPPSAPALKTVLPHIFDYSQHTLRLVNMHSSPKFDERPKFLVELAALLPKYINRNEASLILCPNRKTLRIVEKALRAIPNLPQEAIHVQYSKGLQALIQDHKDRIDSGQGSILCGVESLCEGLDLPGAYCTHVLITGLPFGSTTSPVEQEWQNLLEKDYFKKRLEPTTIIKFVQMVGRLIRRETDYGSITVFDRRLLAPWAKKSILPFIPPFSQLIDDQASLPPPPTSPTSPATPTPPTPPTPTPPTLQTPTLALASACATPPTPLSPPPPPQDTSSTHLHSHSPSPAPVPPPPPLSATSLHADTSVEAPPNIQPPPLALTPKNQTPPPIPHSHPPPSSPNSDPNGAIH